MIDYKSLIVDENQIRKLYLENEWYAYTNDFESLIKGIGNSMDVIGAYDGDLLVGLIRTIGDQTTVCLIQDILILDSHKHKGIGTHLLKTIFEKYKDVRQVVLMTDINDTRSNQFYKRLGMVQLADRDCMGYILKK